MSTPERHGGHERSDVSVKGALGLTLGIVAATVAAMLGMRLLFVHFAAREARLQAPRTTLVPTERNPLPPEPRLQASPVLDLAAMRAQERATLDAYGWVDRKAGKVRIPVDRAMDLVARRGLPRP